MMTTQGKGLIGSGKMLLEIQTDAEYQGVNSGLELVREKFRKTWNLVFISIESKVKDLERRASQSDKCEGVKDH